MKFVSINFEMSVFVRTDSSITLYWIHYSPHCLKTLKFQKMSTLTNGFFTIDFANSADAHLEGFFLLN